MLSPAHGPSRDGAPVAPDIVISQVYGGGGDSGATINHDFIELFNPGTATVTIDGWSSSTPPPPAPRGR